MQLEKIYYTNGQVQAEGFLKNGLKTGVWVYFYPEGQKEKEINYIDDKENGSFFRWFKNGNIEIECEMVNGKTHGEWKEYYENGLIKEIGNYCNNKYSPIHFWDEKGSQLMENGTGRKIEKFGASEVDCFEQYYEGGIFIKENKITSTAFRGFSENSE